MGWPPATSCTHQGVTSTELFVTTSRGSWYPALAIYFNSQRSSGKTELFRHHKQTKYHRTPPIHTTNINIKWNLTPFIPEFTTKPTFLGVKSQRPSNKSATSTSSISIHLASSSETSVNIAPTTLCLESRHEVSVIALATILTSA